MKRQNHLSFINWGLIFLCSILILLSWIQSPRPEVWCIAIRVYNSRREQSIAAMKIKMSSPILMGWVYSFGNPRQICPDQVIFSSKEVLIIILPIQFFCLEAISILYQAFIKEKCLLINCGSYLKVVQNYAWGLHNIQSYNYALIDTIFFQLCIRQN